ncbi:MAG: glycosyltransferase family A protein [Pseudomonadota bacterium]
MTISVIIPVYNGAKLITRTLDSIVRQTLLPSEVILVDDGSIDDTYEIVKSHPLSAKTTFIVLQKKNGGVSSARNFGMLAAKSKYVAFLDADDEFLPNHIANLFNAAALFPDATLLFGAIQRVFDTPELAFSENHLPDFRKIARSHCGLSSESQASVMSLTLFNDLIKGNFINPSVCMFPRIIDGTPIFFDESLKYAEDRAMFIFLASIDKTIFIDEISCNIYRTGVNVSNSTNGRNSILHTTYSIKALESIINQNLFPEGSREKNLLLNELSTRVDDLLYWSSRTGLKATFAAIKIYRRWSKAFQPSICVRRLCYAALRSTLFPIRIFKRE